MEASQTRCLGVNERLAWRLDQLTPHNIQATAIIAPSVSEQYLRDAFRILAKAHPFLRATIIQDAAQELFFQYQEEIADIAIQCIHTNDPTRRVEIAKQELHSPIPTHQCPLARIVLIQLPTASHIIWTANHLICDGMSGVFFLHDFLQCLSEVVKNKTLALKSYDNEYQSIDALLPPFDQLKTTTRISTPPPADEASLSENFTMASNAHIFTMNIMLSSQETRRLFSQCNHHHVKLTATITAAFLLGLHQKLNKDPPSQEEKSIACNTYVNIRPYLTPPISNQQLGHFVSSLFDVYLVGHATSFWELAYRVQSKMDEALHNQIHLKKMYSFRRLLLSHISSENLLPQMMTKENLVSVNNLGNLDFPVSYGNFSLERLYCTASGALTSHENIISAIIFTLHGCLNLNFQFLAPYINPEEAKKSMHCAIDILKENIREKDTQKIHISAPRKKAPETLMDLLEYNTQHYENNLAYSFINHSGQHQEFVTWKEVSDQAKQVAANLVKKTHRSKECILIACAPGLHFIRALFGSLYANSIAVPAYPPLNEDLLEKTIRIIKNSKPRFGIISRDLQEKMLTLSKQYAIPIEWLNIEDLLEEDAPLIALPRLQRKNLFMLQYTSGSTGNPKGVMLSHYNLLQNLQCIDQQFGQKNHIGVSWLPPYHDMGLIGGILQPLYWGSHIILMSPLTFLQNPTAWLHAISRYHATASGGPNFAFDYCVKHIKEEEKAHIDLSTWEVAFCGSEPIFAETLERFYEAFKTCGFRKEAFLPCYGLAEATLMASGAEYMQGYRMHSLPTAGENEHSTRVVSCGKPVQNIRIVNPDTHQLCKDGVIGEIWINGPCVSKGYFRHPQVTRKTFGGHISEEKESMPYLRTGDLGFIVNDELYVTGRIKDLIIIQGRNFYSQDIEKKVEASHPLIRPGYVVAFSVTVNNQEQLIVAVEMRKILEGQPFDEIIAAIQHIQMHFGFPFDKILLLGKKMIKKTTSGKLRRFALREAYLQGKLDILYAHENIGSADSPNLGSLTINAEDVHLTIEKWIKETFHLTHVDREMDLAELGISSVQFVSLIMEIQKRYGIVLDHALFYSHLTITKLAEKIAQGKFKYASDE